LGSTEIRIILKKNATEEIGSERLENNGNAETYITSGFKVV
jgi:hypothetical protein